MLAASRKRNEVVKGKRGFLHVPMAEMTDSAISTIDGCPVYIFDVF